MTFDHAYALEVAQTLIACAVSVVVCWGLWDAWIDVNLQRLYGTKAHLLLACSHRQRQIWRLILAMIVLYIGAWSVVHPPPPESGHFWASEQMTVGRILFMLATISHGMASALDWNARRRLAQMFEEQRTA